MRVSKSTVFAQAAHDDGDAGEEEDQAYDDSRHHQRRHQEGRLPSRLPLTAAVRVLPMALVGAHCRETDRERVRPLVQDSPLIYQQAGGI